MSGADRPAVSVLIVSYNGRDALLRCLDSLRGLDLAEIIVLDNASRDGTVAALAAAHPEVVRLVARRNLGFGRGVNLAARHARGEVLVLLNPDTVASPAAVLALVDHVRRHPEAGLVGGRTLTEGGALEPSSCWGAPSLWSAVCFASGLSTVCAGHRWFDPESLGRWRRDDVREVPVVTGCLLAVSAPTWAALGGFDPRYALYGEDTELSLRARRLGFRPQITPAATVVHSVGGSSSDRGERRMAVLRGKVTVYDSLGPWVARPARGLLVAGVGLRALAASVLARRGRSLSAEERAWQAAWAGRRRWWRGHPPLAEGEGLDDAAELVVADADVAADAESEAGQSPSAGSTSVIEMAARRTPNNRS